MTSLLALLTGCFHVAPDADAALHGWWEASDPCPSGATLRGALPPEGDRVFCSLPLPSGLEVPHGMETVFFPGSMQRQLERGWDAGAYDGPYRSWYPNGEPQVDGAFDRDEQTGTWTWYYESGQVQTVDHFAGGLLDGVSERWYPNGVKAFERAYDRGLLHGISYFWTERGRLLGSREFDHGTGLYTEWYSDGTKSAEGPMLRGQKDGEWLWWDEAGRLAAVEHYAAGQMHGSFTYFGPKGEVLGSFEMEHGSGVWQGWHDNGVLAAEGPMVEELRHGTWVYFDEAGQPYLEQQWDSDIVVSERSLVMSAEGGPGDPQRGTVQ